MRARAEATVEDLYRVEGKAEIVNGEIVFMPPTGFFPGRVGSRIYNSLLDYEAQTNSGYAVPEGVGFIVDLPNRKSFSPDGSYFVGELSEENMRFIDGAPIFAAEVRSENDYGPAAERAMANKRADYFAAGTKVVWDVDLLGPDVVRVYRATDPNNPTVYRRGDIAEAEPALPGWKMPVDSLFPAGKRGK